MYMYMYIYMYMYMYMYVYIYICMCIVCVCIIYTYTVYNVSENGSVPAIFFPVAGQFQGQMIQGVVRGVAIGIAGHGVAAAQDESVQVVVGGFQVGPGWMGKPGKNAKVVKM